METNVYQVIKNGIEIFFTHSIKKVALRKAHVLARNKSIYVEVWFFLHGDGSRELVTYWN